MTMSSVNSQASIYGPKERKELTEFEKTNCRLGICCRPRWARPLGSPILLLICYGFSTAVQGMIFTHYMGVISTFEAHFQLRSEVLGMVMSIGELVPIFAALVFGYFCGAGDRPRWISFCCWLISIGCLVAALPFFIYGAPEQNQSHNGANSTQDNPIENLCTEISNISAFAVPSTNETDETCNTHSAYEHSNIAVGIYLIGYTLFNCGAVILYVVGTPYMDDNVRQKNSPLYMGIVCSLRTIGPMFGFLLSFFCLSFHVTLVDSDIDPDDPQWVGAWWLGYVIIAGLSAIGAICIAQFPIRLPSSHLTPAMQMELNQLSTQQEISIQKKTSSDLGSKIFNGAKKFLQALRPLLANRLFLFRIASEIFTWFAMESYVILLPKYMEHQFNIPTSEASAWTAFATIAPIVLGDVCVGFYIQHFNPSPRKLSFTLAVSKLIYTAGIIGLVFFQCNLAYVSGLDTSVESESCKIECECPTLPFHPVCAENRNFLSACHAGCTTINSTADTLFYENCSCADGGNAFPHLCPGTCPEFPFYIAITTVAHFLSSVNVIAGLIFFFRIVSIEQKTLAMGLYSMCLSLFTFVPCPIIVSALVDTTCAVWATTCGETGACLLYDIDKFRYLLHGLPFALAAIACIFDFWFCLKSSKIDLYGDEEPEHTNDETRF